MNRMLLAALSGALVVASGCSGKGAANTGNTSKGTSSSFATLTGSASTASGTSSGSHLSSSGVSSTATTSSSASTSRGASSSSNSSTSTTTTGASTSGSSSGPSSSSGSTTWSSSSSGSSSGAPQACVSLPFTVSNGDIGSACTLVGDGGTVDCDVANGEICLQWLLPDGGANPNGICSLDCTFGAACPNTSICHAVDTSGSLYCVADCNIALVSGNGSACPGSLSCNPTSPNPADPGYCSFACQSNSDCNPPGSSTTFSCSTGVCRCGDDADCIQGACDPTTGACYWPCQGPNDLSTCQSGCCGEVNGTNYCDTNATPALLALCVSCFDNSQCASGNCDSQSFCNLPASTLCTQTPAACSNIAGGASCDEVTDNCTCPGEVVIADGGSCFSTPFNPFDDGDLGLPCQNLGDAGMRGCASGEQCSPLATDGGTLGSGFCVAFCDHGQPCPGLSFCLDGLICEPNCLVTDGGGCPPGQVCAPQTPNPADPGTCSPPCATNADCNGSPFTDDGGPETAEICSNGTCLCTTDRDCNGGVTDAGPGAFACDLPSGVCYIPCGSQKSCGTSVGGCCESLGAGRDYCNPTSGSELPLKPTCSSCVSDSECASGFCDPAGHCQVTDLCSQSQGECGFAGSTCEADNCLCGEPDAGLNGGACYLRPVSVGEAGGLGGSCTVLPDGGTSGCQVVTGEFCEAGTLPNGGVASTGFCTLDCTATAICPGSSTCFNLGSYSDCLANCSVQTDGGSQGCGSGTICIRLSPDFADPGACYPPVCETNDDCNYGGSAFVCKDGNCLCTTDNDCASEGTGLLCDLPSGQCYTPCGDNKECEISSGGCCEEDDTISFCDPNGSVLPDGGFP